MNLYDFVGTQNLEEAAGLEVEVLIAAYDDVEEWPALPNLSTGSTNAAYVDYASGTFTMKTGKQFHTFEGTLQKNGFTSELKGPAEAMSFENMLKIARSSMSLELLGWVRANRNRKLVVGFKPLGFTKYLVLGYKGIPAQIVGGLIDIPSEIQGEKMTSLDIMSIYYPPLAIAALPITPAA
jgi:hypothetical protein